MGIELDEALLDLDADESIRAIVVTGAGEHFCVGVDLGADAENRLAWLRRAQHDRVENEPPLRSRPWTLATPIIAAIKGAALGVGLTLPMQWDIRIAASDSKLG